MLHGNARPPDRISGAFPFRSELAAESTEKRQKHTEKRKRKRKRSKKAVNVP